MVDRKHGCLCIGSYYRDINKITIKDKFMIHNIDELHGEVYFQKLDLHLGYIQIRMKEEGSPQKNFRSH